MIDADAPPLRVAMDVTALAGPITGVGEVVRQLVTRLPQHRSLDLTGLVVSWRGRGQLARSLPDGWAFRPMAMPARVVHAAWRRLDRPRLKGFDLVHGPNYVVPPTDGSPRLVTVHDLTAWRFPGLVDDHSRSYPRHLARAVADGAHVHTVSEHVAGELAEALGIDDDRIHVVPNGLEPGLPGSAERGRSLVGGPYVLAVGTVEPRKDYVSLVRAMADIWPVFPDVRLAIAGVSGWGQAELDDVIAELGVADRVRFLGYVSEPEKADLLAGAELMAYPSLYEGFGLPVLEAMQAGVPVVSTRAGAIPEVAGRAAVLVEPRDPSALAGALLSVIEDDDLRAKLAEAGRTQAGHYSWDDTLAGLVDCYRLVAGRSVPVTG